MSNGFFELGPKLKGEGNIDDVSDNPLPGDEELQWQKSSNGKKVRRLMRKRCHGHQNNIIATHLRGKSPKKSKLILPGAKAVGAKLSHNMFTTWMQP
jgi:hypothetical protein